MAALKNGDVVNRRHGKLLRPKRLPGNLFKLRPSTGEARCILDCITSPQNGADLLRIEASEPQIGQIGNLVKEIRKAVPNAKLVYNDGLLFNHMLDCRQHVYDGMKHRGEAVSVMIARA